MSAHVNLVLDQGSFFEHVFGVQNEDGTPMDLTLLTPYSQMRKSYYTSTAIDLTVAVIGDPVDGYIQMTVQPTETDSIRPGRYVYDIEVHGDGPQTGYVKRVLEGVINVTPQVTRIGS